MVQYPWTVRKFTSTAAKHGPEQNKKLDLLHYLEILRDYCTTKEKEMSLTRVIR